MPELPDVEVFKRYMDATALHQKVERAEVRDRDILRDLSPRTFRRHLEGEAFRSTLRHGKWLLAETTAEEWLVLHFGMTGFLKYYRDEEKEPGHPRLVFRFDNGYRLAFDCQRKLGGADLTADPDDFLEKKGLGPDALSLDLARFRSLLAGRRGGVKSALMNQGLLAGVGNVYSDEALFQAEIPPRAKVADLGEEQVERLFRSLNSVLETAIGAKADPDRLPRDWLLRRREEGAECPKCGGEIRRSVVSGRGCYHCPGHQNG